MQGRLKDNPNAVRVPVQTPGLVDQYGQPLGSIYGTAYDPPRDPLTGIDPRSLAGAVYRDIPVSNTVGDWSVDDIQAALESMQLGQFANASRLADAIFGDDRVQATLGSRTGGLFSQRLIHTVARDDSKHREVRRAWKKAWRKLLPQSVGSEIIRWGTTMGFCVCEVLWDTSVTPWQPYLKPWHPQFLYYRFDTRKLVALTIDGPVDVVAGNGKWFVFAPHGEYRGWMQAAIRAIARPWLIKRLAWRDWARFNERHGLPIIKAQIPAAGDPQQKVQFIQSMRTLGQQAVIGLPQNVDGTGYDVELMEAVATGWESFMATIDRCDQSIILPILWQNLTTQITSEGSYAAARVHADVRQTAIQLDDATLSEAVFEQLARPFALLNFGDADLATFSHWDVTPPEDLATKAKTFVEFSMALNQLRQAGFEPTDVRALAHKFGLSTGELEAVAPLQVAAKLAGAPSANHLQSEDEPLKAYKEFREVLASLDARLAA